MHYIPITILAALALLTLFKLIRGYGERTGYKHGYSRGKHDGFDDGRTAGYTLGKIDGIEEGWKRLDQPRNRLGGFAEKMRR